MNRETQKKENHQKGSTKMLDLYAVVKKMMNKINAMKTDKK